MNAANWQKGRQVLYKGQEWSHDTLREERVAKSKAVVNPEAEAEEVVNMSGCRCDGWPLAVVRVWIDRNSTRLPALIPLRQAADGNDWQALTRQVGFVCCLLSFWVVVSPLWCSFSSWLWYLYLVLGKFRFLRSDVALTD
jgi:hypothetical protein